MGDIPIYVTLDSAEVWSNPHQFLIDEDGNPDVVAGVPPDIFSKTGQLWGNPCYDWDAMASDGYSWWLARFRRTFDLADIVRVDHFRGFMAGWQVPSGSKTAVNGEWAPGPGRALFDAVSSQLGTLPIVVEDLGVITQDVIELRESLGYPGMKILQFAFDGDPDNFYLPHHYPRNCMVYTGTHDNDTTRGWFASLDEESQGRVTRYVDTVEDRVHTDMIRLAWSSSAVLACAPVQDVIGLGSEARMNVPGKARGNWSWRLSSFDDLERRLDAIAELSERFDRSAPPLANPENGS